MSTHFDEEVEAVVGHWVSEVASKRGRGSLMGILFLSFRLLHDFGVFWFIYFTFEVSQITWSSSRVGKPVARKVLTESMGFFCKS